MDIREKYEHSKFLIARFDHYYDSVNNKGSFYLVINTFILGGIISSYAFFQNTLEINLTIKWIIVAICLAALSSIAFAILAVNPFLTSGDSKKSQSLIFYGSIAEMKEREFIEAYNKIENEKIDEDISQQIYTLSSGLKNKYGKLKIAGFFLVGEFVLISIIIISLLTKII